MFGKHQPAEVREKGMSSPAATFTRGLSLRGTQWKFKFANGFGASVIDDGYGREAGKYELAVLGPDGHLTYDTPITDDVLGWLSAEDVAATLDRIEALSADDVAGEIKARADRARDERVAELRAELARLESEVSR